MKKLIFKVIIPLFLTAIFVNNALAAEAFSHIWSGFSTSLSGRSAEQRRNAVLAGEMLNGKIIPAGGVLSFNEIVGARDREKGFVPAPNITGSGMLEDVPGGGICQLASTLYNTALLGGLDIVERHPHSRTVWHVPPGRDATISGWRKDLKLRNPFDQPLLLKVSSSNDRLNVSFRSLAEKDFQVEIKTEQSQLEPDTVARHSSAKSQAGAKGFMTQTIRVIRKNGFEKKEPISTDVYPAPSRVFGETGD